MLRRVCTILPMVRGMLRRVCTILPWWWIMLRRVCTILPMVGRKVCTTGSMLHTQGGEKGVLLCASYRTIGDMRHIDPSSIRSFILLTGRERATLRIPSYQLSHLWDQERQECLPPMGFSQTEPHECAWSTARRCTVDQTSMDDARWTQERGDPSRDKDC